MMSIRLTNNVLVPGWIMCFGCVALSVPRLDVLTSLSLLAAGVLVVPAIMVWLSDHSPSPIADSNHLLAQMARMPLRRMLVIGVLLTMLGGRAADSIRYAFARQHECLQAPA